jgi:trypsin
MKQDALLLLLASSLVSAQKTLRSKNKRFLGQQHIPIQSRIIGGSEAPTDQYPWFVQWSGCGASLIHTDIILSAAHCNPNPDDFLLIGAHKTSDDETTDGVYARNIVRRRPHPLYSDSTLANDFMVMKLDAPVPTSPIVLNEDSSNPRPQESLKVMGFGLEEEDGYQGSSSLMEVEVNTYSHENCNILYDGEISEDVMFCAGVPEGGQDSCQGDSGGPIINEFGNQVGIVSWGYGCGRSDYPGVYARVSDAFDWINEQICELSDFKPESCGNPIPTDAPTAAPQGSIPVRIKLNLDDYPEEVSLKISRDSNIILSKGTGELGGLYEFSETLNLLPGNYKLELFDSYGDGFCCNHGQGSYVIEALYPNDEETSLSKGDGVFLQSLVVDFSVPQDSDGPREDPSPTPSPSSPPTFNVGPPIDPSPTASPAQFDPPLYDECEDNSASTFLIDSVVGNADCNWLKINLDRYNYLCQFLDVAHYCPKTCNACDYF